MAKKKKDELRIKPCLFCLDRKRGGIPRSGFNINVGFYVYCGCRCAGPARSTERAAIKAWNKVWENAIDHLVQPQ